MAEACYVETIIQTTFETNAAELTLLPSMTARIGADSPGAT